MESFTTTVATQGSNVGQGTRDLQKKKKRKTDQNIATLFSLLEMCETLLRQLTSSKGRNQTGCEVGLFF